METVAEVELELAGVKRLRAARRFAAAFADGRPDAVRELRVHRLICGRERAECVAQVACIRESRDRARRAVGS